MTTQFGFGVELETELRVLQPQSYDARQLYLMFAGILQRNGIPAAASSGAKYPNSYLSWWITRDSSITTTPNVTIPMESVSRVLRFASNVVPRWDDEIRKFWTLLAQLFEAKKNLSCGTHVHVAPSGRSFALWEVQAIAFACCYYEPYVISVLPQERRDYRYCLRNTRIPGLPMGSLFRAGMISRIAEEIKRKQTFAAVSSYVQGSVRTVIWNFQNLSKPSGTIEFRAGRHMRGPKRTLRWITFVLVFVSLALSEKLIFSSNLPVVNNDSRREVQKFWDKVLRQASMLGVRSYLPSRFKMMSEKEPSDN